MFIPSPKKMTEKKFSKKGHIVDLYKRGWNQSQIIENYGYAKSTVYAAIVEYKKIFESSSLTPANYAKARKLGINKKDDLAKALCVHPKKLQRFEKELRERGDFDKYIDMLSNGYGLESVLEQLAAILEILHTFEPDSKNTATVKDVILTLKEIGHFDQSRRKSK